MGRGGGGGLYGFCPPQLGVGDMAKISKCSILQVI